MPQALVDKVKQSEKFNQGYATVEYLAAAILDMELHTRTDGEGRRQHASNASSWRGSACRARSRSATGCRTSITCLAATAYSAGYYSYLWSDVMAADTWQAFVETRRPWDKAVAGADAPSTSSSNGNTSDRAEAYRQFRGRDPDVKALLAKRGFPAGR